MSDNELDLSAGITSSRQRLQAAGEAFVLAFAPDPGQTDAKISDQALTRLSYYEDEENPRHPAIVKQARDAISETRQSDIWLPMLAIKAPEAKEAVDAHVRAITYTMAEAGGSLPALPDRSLSTLNEITPADIDAWASALTTAEQALAVLAAEAITAADSFASLLRYR